MGVKKTNIMTINKPNSKPKNPNFSSGPTTKRPNWSLSNLESALLGRSHRSIECKSRLKKITGPSKSYKSSGSRWP